MFFFLPHPLTHSLPLYMSRRRDPSHALPGQAEREHLAALERQREHERRRTEQEAKEHAEARERAHREGREW